jgi:hypothetical protein
VKVNNVGEEKARNAEEDVKVRSVEDIKVEKEDAKEVREENVLKEGIHKMMILIMKENVEETAMRGGDRKARE